MAVRKIEEILDSVKTKIGDATDDETISFIEDISDTLNDYETRVKENGDWKTKYDELDKNWRERYRDRFFNQERKEDEKVKEFKEMGEEANESPKTFEDLFSVEEDK